MSAVKPHLSYDEQIKHLREKGCIIDDADACKDILENVGYYRLSAYFLPFKKEDGSYQKDLAFERIWHIYDFDRELRNILFAALEVIEVSFRARLAYYHSEKYGPLGYMNPATFNKKHNSKKFRETLSREIENNRKVLFVKHHIDKYNGHFPLWVISELFTFGTVSYFYNDLLTTDKKAFAGVEYKEMASWLRCCTDLRNICAHYGRLYFRVFTAMPAGFNISETERRRLWGAVLTVKALYPYDQNWNAEFLPSMETLFEKYKSDIDLYHLAFPKDWNKQLKK